MEKIKIEVTREEHRAIMDCVTITRRSIEDGMLMVPKRAHERFKKIGLKELWLKIYETDMAKKPITFVQHPQINT